MDGTRVPKSTFRSREDKVDMAQEKWGNPGEILESMVEREQVVLPLHASNKNQRVPHEGVTKILQNKTTIHCTAIPEATMSTATDDNSNLRIGKGRTPPT